MNTITSNLEAHGLPVFGRLLGASLEGWARIAPVLRRAWESNSRKQAISWTKFREKRLTLRGFLSFDRNARLRTYVYLAILVAHLGALYGPVTIVGLVRIACQAIEMAGLPQNVYATMRYETAMEVSALRQGLTARYDVNRNGRLDPAKARTLAEQTGLAPGDLTASVVQSNLGKLLTASYDQQLLPKSITSRIPDAYEMKPGALLRALRRWNYEAGMAEYERQRTQMWREVDRHLAYGYAEPKDYLRWETWRRGLNQFYTTGRSLVSYAAAYADPRSFYLSVEQVLDQGFDGGRR